MNMNSMKTTGSSVKKSEHYEQRELVSWFRRTWPEVRIFAIPNGGARSAATAGRLKAEGVSRGVPDLFVPAWRLWLEMKRSKGGSLDPAQRDWLAYLESVGYATMVCRGCEDAQRQIRAFACEMGDDDG